MIASGSNATVIVVTRPCRIELLIVFELKQKCDKKTSFVRPVGNANILAKNSPEVKF